MYMYICISRCSPASIYDKSLLTIATVLASTNPAMVTRMGAVLEVIPSSVSPAMAHPLITSQTIEGDGAVTSEHQKAKQTTTNQSANKTTNGRKSAIVQQPDSGRNGKGDLRNSLTEHQAAIFTSPVSTRSIEIKLLRHQKKAGKKAVTGWAPGGRATPPGLPRPALFIKK